MGAINYSKTVNLPQTAFPMKGDMAKREPQWLELWGKLGIYQKLQDAHKNDPLFILHDGPPYANGQIHIGHALNKILKDIIVKFKAMSGHRAPYVPGWDCHGLPIENQLMKDLKMNKREVERGKFRKQAAQFAAKYIGLQKQEFIRLGVFGEWERPYLTMDPVYEAGILKAFFELLDKGYIYRDKKPVYWCPYDETALADAEVDYEDKPSDSIYVRFPLSHASEVDEILGGALGESKISVVIWTTTPWTLPANVGLAFHPRERYVLVNIPNHGKCYVAERRISALSEVFGTTLLPSGDHATGEELVRHIKAKNPLTKRDSVGITADFVSMEDGTGIVHIAPGHGEDDYAVGHLQNKLPILCPVDEQGRFTKEVGIPSLEGKHVLKDANQAVINLLEQSKSLVYKEKIQHSYPCCWRCKNPVIYRATEQWFLSVEKDGLREKLIQSLSDVRFVPSYGVKRIKGMLEVRPDWCLTRQRYWGTPLPLLYCEGCRKPYHDKAFQDKVLKIIGKEGSDAWFERPISDFLSAGAKCTCGKTSFQKEEDILDVWFDSGTSWKAVLENTDKWPEFKGRTAGTPVMYLEGSDQHRGWFQTSLIPSVALKDEPPYNEILTHGFVVDMEGQKMSKSKGNVVAPQDVIKKYGADILRWWVAHTDYSVEMGISDKLLEKEISESYRKIRNTLRFLLGNLADFDPGKHRVPVSKMEWLDRQILHATANLIKGKAPDSSAQDMVNVEAAYKHYNISRVLSLCLRFCIHDLSGSYLDIQKDMLYCEPVDSPARRSAQTAMFEIVCVLAGYLAPILSFTMEEIWQELHGRKMVPEPSVFLRSWSSYPVGEWLDSQEFNSWDGELESLQLKVNALLEADIKNGKFENSREVVLVADPALQPLRLDESKGVDLDWWSRFLRVSKVQVGKTPNGKSLDLIKSIGQKCPRCWRWREDVGGNKDLPELCARCAGVVSKMNLTELKA